MDAARRDGQVLIVAGSFPTMPPDRDALFYALESRYLAHGLAAVTAA